MYICINRTVQLYLANLLLKVMQFFDHQVNRCYNNVPLGKILYSNNLQY